MKITGWTNIEDESYKDVGEMSNEKFDEIMDFVINEVKERGYKFSGKDHQYKYCPIIDDEYLFGVSMRTWGEIMVKAHNLPNEDGLGYVRWAWVRPEDEECVYPETEEKEE